MNNIINICNRYYNISNVFVFLLPFSTNKFNVITLQNNKKSFGKKYNTFLFNDYKNNTNFLKLVSCVTKKGNRNKALKTVLNSFIYIKKITRLSAFLLLEKAIMKLRPMFRLIKLNAGKKKDVYLPKLLNFESSRNLAVRAIANLAFDINKKEKSLYKSIALGLLDCSLGENTLSKKIKQINRLAFANKHMVYKPRIPNQKHWYYKNTLRVIKCSMPNRRKVVY